ncbi:MAG: hypothetical protein HOL70_06695 [Candidatus Marinimicrobia bacterium]|jgi:hypothetical protein|nr:hypothetical protein [Candidatus Neomarinimicrobiota bacterium]
MKNKKDSQADPANAAAMELMKRELIRAKVKRTIRTSFTLSPECLDSMDTMIAQRGLTYSELFDYAEVMIEAIKGIELKDSSASGFSSDKKKSKSFAIGTQALAKISENAKNRKIPRDRYVEMLMVSLDEYLKKIDGLEVEVVEKYREAILIAGGTVDEIAENLAAELGDSDHPLIEILGAAGVMLMNADMAIDEFLGSGEWPGPYL